MIDIEDAVRMNVSAMAVMLAIGDPKMEAKTVANLYHAANQGAKYGIPVMGVTAVGNRDGTRCTLLRFSFTCSRREWRQHREDLLLRWIL